MSILEAILFGIVQGISEFLPISSTAHIIITQFILGYQFPGLAFEIWLHFASILAVVIYFYKDLWNLIKGFFLFLGGRRSKENRIAYYFGLYIIAATLITGFLGILLEGIVSETMKTPAFISITLSITGIMIIITERFRKYGDRREEEMSFKDAAVVGIGQAIAVLPGISRSGATLIPALWLGLNRETAVKFSFFLVIPVILGSTLLQFSSADANLIASIGILPLLVSFVTTFIFSLIGIIWLIKLLQKSKLSYFALYCFVLAAAVYLYA
ncbi:undecaprenyl-diphosphatase [Bacillus lacus]|uniref:Undecaprenyl-diphosphatase n=1 Tax=Metabacillus lacus TaxID=1983721 RepID=A0A7X2J326_9BACI|nr:undecaprenyl-diphosphate phosphatase [Metabacillus lacus]MRX74399.1 undecaprenyl-diphosphatase [Metabacillus lacus]